MKFISYLFKKGYALLFALIMTGNQYVFCKFNPNTANDIFMVLWIILDIVGVVYYYASYKTQVK